MIKIFASGSLSFTPFTKDADMDYFSTQGVKAVDEIDADLIISGNLRKLFGFMLRFGQNKKYLLWTIEPRFNKYFEPVISYPLLPTFHVMNVYNEVFNDNYYFVSKNAVELNFEICSEFKSKKIVAVMTYQAGSNWRLFHKGTDIDLSNLRTKIALEGYQRGCLDIYGRNWPNQINIGESRDSNWQGSKIDILKQYHFNLCFENTNWPHYCTEKIWHSIQGGCLPIYYGKDNRIYDDFPKNSFLDYCDFNDVGLLLDYVQDMKLNEFQERMTLCIQTFNRIVELKLAQKSYQRLLERTLLKISEICN
jgi:alpha(1,3/1,4) fucosyltransferase